MSRALMACAAVVFVVWLTAAAARGQLVADFTASPTGGVTPVTVQFQDATTGAPFPLLIWDFGDGTTATGPAPVHTYASPGSYTVTLTAQAFGGLVDTETKPGFVVVRPRYREHRLPAGGTVVRVHVADLDADGDADVLAALPNADRAAWYENVNGRGRFVSEQPLLGETPEAWSVFAADIDGDGDLDALSASAWNDRVAWYPNTDGLGRFGPGVTVADSVDGAFSVHATDLDGDGDADVLSAASGGHEIAWHENTNGRGRFAAPRLVSDLAVNVKHVYAADLDGDGDQDVLHAAESSGLFWTENLDGRGTFALGGALDQSFGAWSVKAPDLDGDGDRDLLAAITYDGGLVRWYENRDGLGDFGPPQLVDQAAAGVRSVHYADLDNDGDLDVLSAELIDDEVMSFENLDGLGSFDDVGVLVSDTADNAYSVDAADVDLDGDVDVIAGCGFVPYLAWYENLLVSDG